MIALVLQAIVTLLVSALLLLILQPGAYFLIGGVVALICCALMINVRLREESLTFWTLLFTILLTTIVGLFWPVVPCATTYAVLVDHYDDHEARPTRSRGH